MLPAAQGEAQAGDHKEMLSCLPLLTNSAHVYESHPNAWGGGGVAGSQPMSTAVHIT